MEPHDYRIYYANIDLRHQYGISVAVCSHRRSSARNVPSGEEREATDVFAGYSNEGQNEVSKGPAVPVKVKVKHLPLLTERDGLESWLNSPSP